LHEAVKLDPCFAPAHYSLGKWYRVCGNLDRAFITTAHYHRPGAARMQIWSPSMASLLVMTGQSQRPGN